jgi:succinylglutamic semialdehyde dehydrogenase
MAAPLVQRIAEIARGMRIGHPLSADVFMGPMISEASRAALWRAQALADAAGYAIVTAGGRVDVAGHDGFYVQPAVRVAPTSLQDAPGYRDEELFGPDLAVYPAADLDEAIALANDTRFGLAASVFTASRAAFDHAGDELRVGVVHWNRSSAGATGRLPFGGMRDSGNHHPAGILAATACAYPQGRLLEPTQEGPLPNWPGVSF